MRAPYPGRKKFSSGVEHWVWKSESTGKSLPILAEKIFRLGWKNLNISEALEGAGTGLLVSGSPVQDLHFDA